MKAPLLPFLLFALLIGKVLGQAPNRPPIVCDINEDTTLIRLPLGSLSAKAFPNIDTNLLEIIEVTNGGPADQAGLRVGDFLYGVNGERLPEMGSVHDDAWRGTVTELGYAIERAESGNRVLTLQILRADTGPLSLTATLADRTAWLPSLPIGDQRMDDYVDIVCANIHAQVQASGFFPTPIKTDGTPDDPYFFGPFYGMILLAHPNWNKMTDTKPYGQSVQILKQGAIDFLASRVVEPVNNGATGYVSPGWDNWHVTVNAMFLGEYRRKSGDTSVDTAAQRAALVIANRVRDSDGRMGHGGVSDELAYGKATNAGSGNGLNIINAQAMLAMGMLKGAGVDFTAPSRTTGKTINDKLMSIWGRLKDTTNVSSTNERGSVGYAEGVPVSTARCVAGWDTNARTPAAAAGYIIYLAAGGTAATTDDLTKLDAMIGYTPRNWQRQQNGHAYTLGSAFSQMLLPFVTDRERSYFMENSRFLLTMSQDDNDNVLYFPGRANIGGDLAIGYESVRHLMPGLTWAIASGNLPSFPQPASATSRVFVRMNSPLNDWPKLEARRIKVVGFSQALDLDVTDHEGNVLPTGYTASWEQISGDAMTISSLSSLDTSLGFSAEGDYRARLTVTKGSYTAIEDYDFEVVASTPPIDTSAAIIDHPRSSLFSPGGNATFSTKVADVGPFVYHWTLNGAPVGKPTPYPSYTFTNLGAASAGLYQCTITHPGGQLTTDCASLGLTGTVAPTSGGLKREVWNGLTGSTKNVTGLTNTSRFPLFPDSTSTVNSAEAPRDVGSNYGQRLSGWVIPPTSGSYTFYLTSDDASELWLSTDADPAKKVRRISGKFTGYRFYSASQSFTTNLVAGQRYYIEALHFEVGGGDHVSVAWRKPGDPVPASGSAPIPGEFLESEVFARSPQFEGLVSWWPMDEDFGNVIVDQIGGNEGVLDGPSRTNGIRRGALSFDNSDRVLCSNTASLGGLTPFTVAAWVKVDAGNATDGVIVQQRSSSGFNGQYQLLVKDSGKVQFYCFGDSTEQFRFDGDTLINDGEWHHVAAMRDSSGGARIYIDGLLDKAITGTTVRNLDLKIAVGIGSDILDNDTFFRGCIDDLRIYTESLTPSQVASLASTPGAVFHGTLEVAGTDNATTTLALQPGATAGISFDNSPNPNFGDYFLDLPGGVGIDQGVLMTSIAQIGDRDGTYHTSAAGHGLTGASFDPNQLFISINTSEAGSVEGNSDVAFGFFPHADWLCGTMINAVNGGAATELKASPGIDLGDEFLDDATAGQFTLNLTSAPHNASSQNGILLVNGAKNEDNYALSQALPDGSFKIYNHDNGVNGTPLEQDPVNFVYVSENDLEKGGLVAMGRIESDGDSQVSAGTFTITKLSIGPGQWLLRIPGHSQSTGTLLVSPEGGDTNNVDNIVNFEWIDGFNGWRIESLDLPNHTGQDGNPNEPMFSFAFFKVHVLTVMNSRDCGAGTLRQAIADASAHAGAIIRFDASVFDGEPADTIRLSHDQLRIPGSANGLLIDATDIAAGVVVDAEASPADQRRVLQIDAGAIVALRHLTLSGGYQVGNDGGAIHSASSFLTLTNCTLSNSVADSGGGLYTSHASGLMTLRYCTLSGNKAVDRGGGLKVNGMGKVSIHSSTFSNNTAREGGGISNTVGELTLEHATLADNAATNEGGGLYQIVGVTTLKHSVIAGNHAAGVGPDIGGLSSIVTPMGVNLLSDLDGSGLTQGSSVLVSQAHGLAPLGDYGGRTWTMPPLPGSPAINAATGSTRTEDQRGFTIADAQPDIGATEFRGSQDLNLVWNTDWDQDGSFYGVELALGTSPTSSDSDSTNKPTLRTNAGGQTVITFSYNPEAPEYTSSVLTRSTDLINYNVELYRLENGLATFSNGATGTLIGTTVQITDTTATSELRYFYRYEAITP